MYIRHFGVRDAILPPSGAKTIVKTMEFPRGKFASGASTVVKTKHSRFRREPQNAVLVIYQRYTVSVKLRSLRACLYGGKLPG